MGLALVLVLELRVLTYGAFDPSEALIVRQTVQALLATADIQAEWRQCGNGDSCDGPSAGRPFVRVHLMPMKRSSDPSKSGDAVRESTGTSIALVYVPRIEEIVASIRRSAAGRSNPALSTLM